MSAALKGPYGNTELSTSVVGVGRSPESQLVINDTETSWYHAQICSQGPGHSVIDLGSRNGTFVNEQRLPPHTPRLLNVGDTIRFGNTSFIYLNESLPYPLTSAHPPTKVATSFSTPVSGTFQGQQTPVNQGSPSKKDPSDKVPPRWTVIVGGLGSLATVLALIWGIYTYLHPAPSSNSSVSSSRSVSTTAPSVPRLHSSYTGSFTRPDGITVNFTMTSLTEDGNGNFTATGADGFCTATYQGSIHDDNSVNFTMTENAVSNSCGIVAAFSGKLFSDGHLAGHWQGQGAFSQTGGQWTMS